MHREPVDLVSHDTIWPIRSPPSGGELGQRVRASSRSSSAPWAVAVLRRDDDSIGGVHDRFVLLIPAHAVVLVSHPAEQLHDLSTPSRLAVDPVRLDPVPDVDVVMGFCWSHGDHLSAGRRSRHQGLELNPPVGIY